MDELENTEDIGKLTARLVKAVEKLSPQRKKMLAQLIREWDRLDYREDSRIPCFLPVDYSTQDRVYQDFIHNLSNGGVFIETAASLRIGQPLSMIFNVPTLNKAFKIAGRIVRTEADGVGVKFDKKLTPYQKELIHKAVNKS